MKLSFPTKKLKNNIQPIKLKYKDVKWKEEYPVYGVTNKEGLIQTGNKTSNDLSNYRVVSGTQFVYNPYRVNVGSLGLSSKDFKGIVSPAYIVFEAIEALSSEFLFYYLKTPLGLNLIKWYGDRGGVRSALRYKDLEQIDIPDLTHEQQLKILTRIKAVDKLLTVLKSEHEKQSESVEKLRQAILQLAVQGKLASQDPNDEPASELLKRIKAEEEKLITEGKIKKQKTLPPITENEIPYDLSQGWEWVRFTDVAYIASNLVNPFDHLDMPHIAPNNIEKNTGKLLYHNTVREDDVRSPNHFFISGQILYSKIRPNLSKVIIANFDGLCSADMYPVYSLINSQYLLIYMLSNVFLDMAVKKDNRVAMPKINQTELKLIPVPVPSLTEQKRIVAKVNQLMHLCDELETRLNQSQKDSEILMQAVLQEAFGS